MKDITTKDLRKAIMAKCNDCCVGDRSEVHKCTSESCPLWRFRLSTASKSVLDKTPYSWYKPEQ